MVRHSNIMLIRSFLLRSQVHHKTIIARCQSSNSTWEVNQRPQDIIVHGNKYSCDEWTNITPKILSLSERKLHLNPKHPLGLIKQRVIDFMYSKYSNVRGNPLFSGNPQFDSVYRGRGLSVHQNLSPIVTIQQNFDSLLVAQDHPSRIKSDSYYLNKNYMMRAHTSAHQTELISMGLDNFLVVGDVYRRDSVDSSHYPVFHQIEGVRLFEANNFFDKVKGPKTHLKLFENDGVRTNAKQETHTLDSALILEHDLKDCLLGLAKDLFGPDIEYRWVDCYFPFTHPSWELEIYWKNDWMEVLGCGIVEQEILEKCGAGDKIGWAFGLGLERLAMRLYQIPDIRLFWSTDPGFLRQFDTTDPKTPITYKEVSKCPPCINDISFWLPADAESYSENDFYDLVRSVGGDSVEHVELFDTFFHPKKKLTSHAYRITYRHLEKTFTQEEVNEIHQKIEETSKNVLGVTIR